MTRSVKASQVSGLSRIRVAAGSLPTNSAIRGPTSPSVRKAEAAPGPPLNAKVIGRLAASAFFAT